MAQAQSSIAIRHGQAGFLAERAVPRLDGFDASANVVEAVAQVGEDLSLGQRRMKGKAGVGDGPPKLDKLSLQGRTGPGPSTFLSLPMAAVAPDIGAIVVASGLEGRSVQGVERVQYGFGAR